MTGYPLNGLLLFKWIEMTRRRFHDQRDDFSLCFSFWNRNYLMFQSSAKVWQNKLRLLGFMAMAAGKHKIFHKSSKITIFNVEIFNNVCKLNLSYLNLLHGHWCLLWKNLIWIIRLHCLYWILHQQRSSYCKEFQRGQRHQRAFL